MTRGQIARAWEAGRVDVEPCERPPERGWRVALDALVFEGDRVLLHGDLVRVPSRHEYAVLNKPRSVTCTAQDPGHRQDLSRWLQAMPPGMFPVGRLDRATTGMLLFTTDGDFSNAMLRPEHHAEKTYWLWLDESLEPNDPRLATMVAGLPLRGRLARAKRVMVQCRTPDFTELRMVLDQGQNQQIRRMCRALGLRLVQLHRLGIGPLRLGTLALGAWRHLEAGEVDALWEAAGGRDLVRERKIVALRRRAQRARRAGEPLERLEAWLERAGVPVDARTRG